MPRLYAQLQQRNGELTKITRAAAFRLLATGHFRLVHDRPMVVAEILHGIYKEEHRHLCGRIIPGATRGRFAGKYSKGGSVRVRVKRSTYDKAALAVNRYLAQQRAEIEERRDKAAKVSKRYNHKRKGPKSP